MGVGVRALPVGVGDSGRKAMMRFASTNFHHFAKKSLMTLESSSMDIGLCVLFESAETRKKSLWS